MVCPTRSLNLMVRALASAQLFCRITASHSAARAGLHAMARNDTHVATTAAAISKAKRNYNDWSEHLLREVERIIGFKCEGGPWFGSLRTTPPPVHTIPNSSLLLQTHEQNILRRRAGFQGGVVGSPLGGM